MFPTYTKINNYELVCFNKKELKYIYKEIFLGEVYNIKLNKKNPKIIDAGAYLGLSLLYFKKHYPQANILAFEPNPNIFPLLEENIEMNNLQNVIVENVALGRKNTTRDFYIDSSDIHSFSTSSFIKNAWNGAQMTIPIQVKVRKLSEYINEEIDLLKMDIEGAEREVLEDLRDSGKLKYINNVIFEFHPTKKNTLNNLMNILKEGNMDVTIREGMDGKDDPLVLVVGKKRSK